MEGLYILLIVIIIILVATSGKGSFNAIHDRIDTLINAIQQLASELKGMRKDVLSLKEKLHDIEKNAKYGAGAMPPFPHKEEAAESKPVIPMVAEQLPPVAAEEVKTQIEATPAEEIAKDEPIAEPEPVQQILPAADPTPTPVSTPVPAASVPQEPTAKPSEPKPSTHTGYPYPEEESLWEKWMRNNPDLEKFIGENLINKIGIAILVLGIAFFVKYAIDQNWINEVGRTCIGLLCGCILIGLAHYLRKGYRSFSSVLAGGGIAVFYFTIAYAFHEYKMFSQTAAFVIMVVITAFAVALSILYDKLELAVIACVGGFVTPFLVSRGDGNYQVLFTYLIILDVGILLLAWFKRWTALNIISLFFTELIYGGWLSTTMYNGKPFSHASALLFATIYFFIFLGMNMVYQLRRNQHFKAFDFIILLFISCSYYVVGVTLLTNWHNEYRGLFTLALGIIYLGLAYYIRKNSTADRNLLFLLIGLTLSFITLTIPIQLHGQAITMFWCAEFVLLYWLSQYSQIRIFRFSSAIVCVLAIGSFMMDWGQCLDRHGNQAHIALIFSDLTGIVTNLVAVASFTVYYFLAKRERGKEFFTGISSRSVAVVSLTAAVVLLYTTCIFLINLVFRNQLSYDLPNVYHWMITEVFALVLLVLLQRDVLKAPVKAQLLPVIACFFFYILSSGLVNNLRDGVLRGQYPAVHIYMHWLAGILMCVIFYQSIQGIRRGAAELILFKRSLMVIYTIMIVVFLSIEGLHVYVFAAFNKNNTGYLVSQFCKAGLTLLWAICSFALMWLGMKHRQKAMRIISLTLFLIVLVKLFLFDISGISEGGKILAFILLGVLLLTVSFMYQKLKKIIFDDGKE